VRVLFDPSRHQNLNLLIKDFLEITGMAISEDYCIKEVMSDIIICSADLLVKGGIYRVSNADMNMPLKAFRKSIIDIQRKQIEDITDGAE